MPNDETTNIEIYSVSCLMAVPELVGKVFPPDYDLRVLENPTARAALQVLLDGGPAFASPGAMQHALADLPMTLDGNDVTALLAGIPMPDEVSLSALEEYRARIETSFSRRTLRKELLAGAQALKKGDQDDAEVTMAVERALREYNQGISERDPSTKGIVQRQRAGQVATRYRIGCDYLDEQNEGVGPDGKWGCGVSALSEIIVIAAAPGTGKTRLLYNWADVLIAQGANIDWIVGEENESIYSAKFLAAKYGVPKSHFELFNANRRDFIDHFGTDEDRAMAERYEWYESISDRLRMHDGQAKANIFKFAQAKNLLERMKQRHGTTHVIIDYVQIYKGEVSVLEGYAQELREFATRNNVSLILASQMSNDTIKFGFTPGFVPAKGSGDWGQIAGFGFALRKDPIIGQQELQIIQIKGRDSGEDMLWAQFDVKTGKVLGYTGTPTLMQPPDDGTEKPRSRGRGGRR